MQSLEVSGAVRPVYGSLGVKRIRIHVTWFLSSYILQGKRLYFRPKFQTVQT